MFASRTADDSAVVRAIASQCVVLIAARGAPP